MFDMDYQFGTALKMKAVKAGMEERWTNEAYGIPRSQPIYEGSFSLTVNSKGEVLSSRDNDIHSIQIKESIQEKPSVD